MLTLKAKRRTTVTTATVVLLFFCALFAFPFAWMVMATFKTNHEVFTPLQFFPARFHLDYYRELFSGQWLPYGRQYVNSLVIALGQTLGALVLSVTAGYVFGRYRFRFYKTLFALAVLVILIPRQVMVLPLFIWFNRLHILDQPLSVILPGMVTGIGVIYFTLVFKNLPDDLADLARTEGASEYRLFLIVMPLIKPALLTYGLIHFILAWHEHLIPLVMLSSEEQMTICVSLHATVGSIRIPYALLMAGSLFTIIPTVLLYVVLRKQFKSSLADLTAQ
ncbi:carbohydrate ABC transporter permease [Fibrobacterota bacterium]